MERSGFEESHGNSQNAGESTARALTRGEQVYIVPGQHLHVSPTRLATTPDGRRLELYRDIDTTVDQAWDLLVDTDRWLEWGPSVRAVDCETRRIRAGSRGTVRIPGGLWLPFEIAAYSPPDDGTEGRWTWQVARIPATGHRVEPRPDGQTRVVFELPVVAAAYVPVCRRALGRIQSILT